MAPPSTSTCCSCKFLVSGIPLVPSIDFCVDSVLWIVHTCKSPPSEIWYAFPSQQKAVRNDHAELHPGGRQLRSRARPLSMNLHQPNSAALFPVPLEFTAEASCRGPSPLTPLKCDTGVYCGTGDIETGRCWAICWFQPLAWPSGLVGCCTGDVVAYGWIAGWLVSGAFVGAGGSLVRAPLLRRTMSQTMMHAARAMNATPPTPPPTMAPVLLCGWSEVEDDASAVVEARAEDGEESDAEVVVGSEGLETYSTTVTVRVGTGETTLDITNAVLDVPTAQSSL